MSENSKYWKEYIAIAVSIVALVISFFAYKVTDKALNYQIGKDAFEKTPVLIESSDSVKISFKLIGKANLQALNLIFPSKLTNKEFKIIVKPIELKRDYLESLLKNYIRKEISRNDYSYSVGIVSVPVLIEYSAIVYGDAQDFREYRLFQFEVVLSEKNIHVNYKNSILMKRYGFPMKGHYFFKMPFSDIPVEKIVKRDSIDIRERLDTDFYNNFSFKSKRK